MKAIAYGGLVMVLVGAGGCGKESSTTEEGEGAPTASQQKGAEKAPASSNQKRAEDEIEKKVPGAVGKGADTSDFGVESAKIFFKVTGMEEGTVTAWIGGHGKTVVLFRDMSKPVAQKQHVVWKNGETTMWKEGEDPYTTRLRNKETELRLVSTLDPKQLEMAGYKKKPNESIADKDCEVWYQEKMNVTLWRWQGIDLKYINGVAKKNPPTVEAMEVVMPSEIPADMIGPPK